MRKLLSITLIIVLLATLLFTISPVLAVTLPTAVTLPATDITSTSARIWGNITDDGGDTCEARFRWCEVGDEKDDWLTGWSYRKSVTVTNASASYQTQILIGKNSSAVGEAVDCGGHIEDDFDDLRFTSSNGETLLDYWIESIADSGGTKLATVWVENDATPSTTCYMYYGKADATAVSNGTLTFIQFEGFEWGVDGNPLSNDGGSVDWAAVSGTPDIDTAQDYGGTRSGRLYHNGSLAEQATFPQTAGATYSIRMRHRKDTTVIGWIVHGNGAKAMTIALDVNENIKYYDTDYRDTGYDLAINTWELLEFNNFNWTAYTYDIWFNGIKIKTAAAMQTRATEGNVVFIGNNAGVSEQWYDDIIVRKWAATAPSWGSWGSEDDQWDWTYTDWQNSLETNDTFYKDLAGLDAITEYEYQTQAKNSAGEGSWSSSAYFTTYPAAPTNVAATDGAHTDKVVITWTKSTGATGYKVYRNGGLIQTLGDVATYDDTGADAPTITPGTASATDGIHTDKVVLSLSGELANNGTAHNYTLKAYNSGGDSPASNPDSGYRGVGALVYQWMVSLGDSNSDYSNIGGASINPYNYTDAPTGTITSGIASASDGGSTSYITLSISGESANVGAGRYYKCYLTATGAAQANSTVDRGYEGVGSLNYQWYRSAADSDGTYSILSGATTNPYNDSTAPAPTINGGNSTASDGISATYVTLNLSNHNATEGDGRYFLCSLSATGAAGQNSTSNRGYRGTTSLVLQWLMSVADSDASYSEIGGATTNPYNDIGGVTESDGRYYKAIVNMTGAASQNSTPDRGYMAAIVAPNVTALAANNISQTSGTLHGNITSTGWENPSTRGFEWGTTSGNYTNNWTEAGNFTTGTFDRVISGLTLGTQIFWRAVAINSEGQGNSTEESFWTLLIPLAPTNFTITRTGTNDITINWTMGVSATLTVIRGSTEGYPETVDDGYLVYNSSGTSVNVTGLSLNLETYYYRAWSWNSYGYSVGYAENKIGGDNMVFIGILALCGILSFLSFRNSFFLLKLLAGAAWIGCWAYFLIYPPGPIVAGGSVHTIFLVVIAFAGVAIIVAGLGRGIQRTEDATGAFSVRSEGFQWPDWLRKAFENPEVEARQSRKQRNDDYRERIHRAYHPHERGKKQ